MNKDNFVKNISLLSRKKSPLPNKNNSTQMSFKNMRAINSKSFVKNQNSHQEVSLSPISTKRNKPSARIDSSILHTEVTESLGGNTGCNLMQAFRLERESLMNTLKMYKQQVEVLSHENARLKKQTSKTRSVLKEKDENRSEEKKKILQLQKKVNDYENMLPKLIELQQLQERVIAQNNGLKTKIKVQQALLGNVANLAKCPQFRSTALDKIGTLTQSYLISVPNVHRKGK